MMQRRHVRRIFEVRRTLSAIMSAIAQLPPAAQVYAVDFSPAGSAMPRMLEDLSPRVTVVKRRTLPDAINAVANEVQRRMNSESGGAGELPVLVFVHGLQRARDLRPDDSLEFSFNGDSTAGSPSLATQFATILREGPEVGVHVVVWCDTINNLNRSLDRRALREFGLRVAMQMSNDDSSNLLDSPAASKLSQFRALFYDEEQGQLEKFRPYTLPSQEWLAEVTKQRVVSKA